MTQLPIYSDSLLRQTDWLRRLTRELVGNRDAADDLAQDTLLAALERPGPTRAGIRTWLERIARNLAAGTTRARHRRQDRERRTARAGAEPATADTIARFAIHRSVVEAVTSLDEPVRTTLLLRFWEDLPPRKIAARMGVPVETVRTRIKRGLQRLRGLLDAEHGGRSAWALPIVGIPSVRHAALPAVGLTLGTAWWIMNTKLVVASVVAALGLLGAYAWWPTDAEETTGRQTENPVAEIETSSSSPISESAANPSQPSPAENRSVVEREESWFAGRVVDARSLPLPDVEVCVISAAKVDERRRPDAPDLSPSMLRIDRTWNTLEAARNRLGEREIFRVVFDAQHVTRTDEEGAFRFPRDAAHEGDLIAVWSPGIGFRFQPITRSVDPVTVFCESWPRICGQVRSAAGELGAPARVTVTRFDPTHHNLYLKTDSAGRYRTPAIPPGRHQMRFSAPRHGGDARGFELSEDAVIDVTLAPLPRLRSRLVDAAGRTWTGDRITAAGWDPEELKFLFTREEFATRAEVDSRGHSQSKLAYASATGVLSGFIKDPAAHVLSVWRESVRVIAVDVTEFGAPRIQIEFPEPPPTTTLGVGVTFADSKPTSAANEGGPEVHLGLGTMAGVGAWKITTDVETKGRKRFFELQVPAHLRGLRCRLVVSAPGYAEQFARVQIPRSGTAPTLQLVLRRADQSVRGKIVDSRNRPVRGARVTLATREGDTMRSLKSSVTTSNASGEFVFGELAEGWVRLFVNRRGYALTSVVAAASGDPTTIRLQPGRERRIRVSRAGDSGHMLRLLDAHGAPLFDDRVYGTLRFGTNYKLRLSPAVQTIQVWLPGAEEPDAEVEVADQPTIDLRSKR